MRGRPLVSYVFPIFNEEGTLPTLFARMLEVTATRPQLAFEFVFINDGSRDGSLQILKGLAQTDKRITIVDFARNFGHQIAVTAGLDIARGDAVIIMDADLQDPPEVSLELIDSWLQGADVVYAQRRTRKDSWFKRFTAWLFYVILNWLSNIEIPRNTGDFRLLSRPVVEELKLMREHNRFLRGMVSFVGFKQVSVLFDRDERFAGKSGYPLLKMFRFASDGIMSFSTTPLRMISATGYFISFLSFIGIIYFFLMKILAPEVTIEGWTFIVISILFMGGIQLIMLGVLGAYIGRTYVEVQNRPLYITREIYTHPRK